MDYYATKCDPHAMRLAEDLLSGLSDDMKRALLTRLVAGGTMPVLGVDSQVTATEATRTAVVWDALMKARPGYMPSAAEAVKGSCAAAPSR